MDKSAIEKFSINARIKLRNSVDSSMAKLGFGPGRDVESIQSIGDITVINLPGGIQTRITNDEAKYRERLAEVISKDGYDNVVEQIAYTWFNRLIAIRYMEVNDFLPTHVRVLSSNNPDKTEPDLVSQCLTVNLGLSDPERETITELRDADRLDELFSKMFIFECRSLNRILPELFTLTKPYENMLLNLSYTSPDSVVRSLVDDIPEDDFRDAVQIIGWMYQYYNSELKDQTFADLKKNVKIPKERIPAATQLFTPDWIVRYMVENSVGRVWLEGHPDQSLRSSWKYFVDEAEQESDVAAKLAEIRAPRADMMPTDIKVIDPCMGSGHILVYAFDVLMQIYLSYGYSKSDAAEMILTDNLYGLDIDDRAYQLAYFAVMMKARQYDPDVFSKNLKPNLHSIPESNGIDISALEGYGKVLSTMEQATARNDLMYLLTTFRDAKTYGSLLKIRNLDWDNIDKFLKGRTITLFSNPEIDSRLHEIVDVAKILSMKFDAVITNPPYMNASGMSADLSKFVKNDYPIGKSDLFSCFIEHGLSMVHSNGYISMITQQNFMFLSSFESLRSELLNKSTFVNTVHLGSRAFDSISGEVVQTVSFVALNSKNSDYCSTYYRVTDEKSELDKEKSFLAKSKVYRVSQSKFYSIPGTPFAYWVDDEFISNFQKGISISSISEYTGSQNKTANNEKYLRMSWEIDHKSIGPGKKWVSYSKGGESRKYYGNLIYVVDWSDEARSFYETNKTSNLLNPTLWYKEGITYNDISTSGSCFRYLPEGCVFDMSGPSILSLGSNLYYCLGFLNSNVAKYYLNTLNPTMHTQRKDVNNIPLIIDGKEFDSITSLVKSCVEISQFDWDDLEYSLNFHTSPLVHFKTTKIENAVKQYGITIKNRIETMIDNENKINQIFNEIYHLRLNVESSTDLHDFNNERIIKDLISYAIGCIFGRFELDPDCCISNSCFEIDSDNIVPINDNEYFGDDVVSRFIDFIEIVFGEADLEDNLKFIANSLNIKSKGTARDKIRSYFLNEFYRDHLKMYSNLPIYWLFDSGKANGFKALIYMHRYTPDLIGKMRQDYLLPMQRRYSEQLKTESDSIARSKLEKKLEEIATYDLAMELYSSNKVSIDLDDGIKVNYAKFQKIDNPGGKGKINLLYKIK